MKFSQLSKVVGGQVLQLSADRPVEALLIDSRKPVISQGAIFFALAGPRHNGHDYLEELYQAGVRQLVIQKGFNLDPALFPQANILTVENTLRALQSLVSYHRSLFTIPVVGITGSNGKTIVKEWLQSALSQKYVVCANPKSYNSQVGVPLSVWGLQPRHEVGVFEAGISERKEMAHLEKMIQPTVGIFTNIGSAHAEGFVSQEEKVREKLRLFRNTETLVYCADHVVVREEIQKAYPEKKHLSWSLNGAGKCGYRLLKKSTDSCEVQLTDRSVISLPFGHEASIENALHVVTCLLHWGFHPTEIQQAVKHLKAPSMRLELKRGSHDNYLIDDTYNNDLLGLEIALDHLVQLHQKETKRVILSDIAQSGLSDEALYQEVAKMLASRGLHDFIAVGPSIVAHQSVFKGFNAQFFQSTTQLLEHFDPHQWQSSLILIKGARKFGFERVVRSLEAKVHGTRLELDLDVMAENLNFYRSKLTGNTKMMVMVKAFAYGSGNLEVAQLLQYHQVDYLGVAFPDEGVELRENGIHLPIMVMNSHPDAFEALIKHGLEPEIFEFSQLKAFGQYLQAQQKEAKIHLKIDTGMHRLGFVPEELPEVIALLKSYPQMRVQGIFSHFVGADEAEFNDFSHEQANRFQQAVKVLKNSLQINPIAYLCNSAGIIRFPEYHFDMVRLGIGLHGIEVSGIAPEAVKLPAKLKTFISQIKHISAQETVGYSRRGKVKKPTTIATIAIGYADGFLRALGNGKCRVKINGEEVPIIGNICMDMAMVDLGSLKAEVGDEVIIFDDRERLLALAEQANTIPYELLSLISSRVKRVYYQQ
ncbi:bifunctional UDP-N-acetylmuramoyl-tripeptide:D-alanyl-D-alanine ligase/alanine racemase [Persicobacter psychrovividus]|uniref:Alanine racemase n=1 Tax=Persicobacter psychrovividus TaxID=387638 RepID=A0ABM7VHD3_9BACT|nr:bifunctional UDP-N-acetylmuramoyl-tripeptide:D-alanyl-D-alanine ligase/alanine racemase [Persicobacter psychrovividus]